MRLNDREYNRKDFVEAGFNHYDLFFEDCTTPDEKIVKVCSCFYVRARPSDRVDSARNRVAHA